MMKKIKSLVVKKFKNKKPPLFVATGANAFWVHQGPVLRSLADLANFLEIMTEEQFAYHIQRNGNDFAHWVAEVIQNKVCAAALARAKTRAAALTATRRALVRYDV